MFNWDCHSILFTLGGLMTEDNITPEEKADKSTVSKLRDLIKKAADDGASMEQLGQLKSLLRQQSNWHPTKKRLSKEKRIQKRKEQKQARKRNRNTFKGVSIRKGIYYRTS